MTRTQLFHHLRYPYHQLSSDLPPPLPILSSHSSESKAELARYTISDWREQGKRPSPAKRRIICSVIPLLPGPPSMEFFVFVTTLAWSYFGTVLPSFTCTASARLDLSISPKQTEGSSQAMINLGGYSRSVPFQRAFNRRWRFVSFLG